MPDDQRAAHATAAGDVLERLGAERSRGLSADAARERRERFGPNTLRRAQRRHAGRILVDQFKSIVIVLLAVAAAVAFATGRLPETVALVAVVAVNTAIGFFSEWRAVRSMEALRRLGARRARVRRDGREQTVGVDALVPGDIVLVGAGDLVPADLRLLDGERLRVSEAALTGESAPVDKQAAAVAPEAPLAERTSVLFKGTTVAEGSAEGVAVATGMDTELGRIAALTEQAEGELTPLEKRLDRLGHRLAWVTVGIAVVVAAVGPRRPAATRCSCHRDGDRARRGRRSRRACRSWRPSRWPGACGGWRGATRWSTASPRSRRSAPRASSSPTRPGP
ncbi:MAG: cation-transporting P-type ATPase [Halofilum sp. (in: g-proteobacteria)]|nr:cation-transporting P-type ATPase [Halofilum sp. (in: g-proteobacteria)]